MRKKRAQTRLSKNQKLKMIDKVYCQNIDYFTLEFVKELNKKWEMFYRNGSYHYRETRSGKFNCIADNLFQIRKQKYRVFVTTLKSRDRKLIIAVIIENVENKRFEIFNQYSNQIGRGVGYYHVRAHGDFEEDETWQIFEKYDFDHKTLLRLKKLERLIEIE